MEKKKLIVNCAICDARSVSELTLKSYEKIVINAASILVSKETKDLFSIYNVSMNAADINEIPSDVEVMIQNGEFEISEAIVISKPTILIVNGSLNIKDGSQRPLENLTSIVVNGRVSYPSNLQCHLPSIKVNGTTDCYPADAIRLKNKVIIDKSFIIKAKENSKYYVRSKVIIPDEALNIPILVDKGVSFITKKAIIAEDLLEIALSLFNEDTDTKVIPAGYSYIAGGKLDDNLIRKHGDKLYVDGDFIINLESSKALEKLTGVKVSGSVLIVGNLLDKFNMIDSEYESIRTIKGTILEDKGILSINKRMLENSEYGITVSDCGVVKLKDDITPEDIEEKLQFIDCGCVFCNEEQRSAIELVSEDVGQINDSDNKSGFLNGMIDGLGLHDKDAQVVNAAKYTM
jgi:hypothetical protein